YEGATGDEKNPVKAVQVPGTVEEYFWGIDGDPYGTNGNYQGVSFWWREFTVPAEWQGKTIVLHFAACRLRSEIFVNDKLVGYDLIGNTPFDVDITGAVQTGGQKNKLCVRITDPNANEPDNNFDYGDYLSRPWGATSVRIPPSHGFGGITGQVTMLGFDKVRVADIFVKNKPTPAPDKPTDIDVDVTLQNDTKVATTGTVRLRIVSKADPRQVVFEQTYAEVPLPVGESLWSKSVNNPNVKIWDLDSPNLYQCEVSVESAAAGKDALQVNFGYRWFTPDGLGTPQACLRLNGKRVFMKSAISWGFWPINGMFPSPELVERQTRMAKAFGLNTLHMHRAIADPMLMDAADEAGLLLYSEPGGYKCDRGDVNARAMATAKLMRFIRRDRNHPSVVVWGMINEIWVRQNVVHIEYLRDMADAHKLDPTRTLVLASGQTVYGKPAPQGSWMMPYEMQRRETGWYDEHRAGSPGVYVDHLYQGPDSFYGREAPADVAAIMGEEGALSAPPQLEAMAADYRARGLAGWDGADHERFTTVYNKWLDAHHARGSFATVDDLCRALGDIAYYYHGRVIESMRAYNVVDAYVINGWECSKMDNHSGIVDPFRRPKGHLENLSYYLRPLYVAVKARRKVLEPGGKSVVDFYLINEKNVHGPQVLEITVTDPGGRVTMRKSVPVTIEGGDQYGQLLARDIVCEVGPANGYTRIDAKLMSAGRLVADGHDDVFAADFRTPVIPAGGEVLDNSSEVQRFLLGRNYKLGAPTTSPAARVAQPVPFVVVGNYNVTNPALDDLLRRVHDEGTTLVFLDNPERWARELAQRKLVEFAGIMNVGDNWVGGSYFALDDPLLTGLPRNTGLNWEYQQIGMSWQPNSHRCGMLLTGDDAAVGCYTSNDPRMGTVLGSIPHGKGRIILTTIPLLQKLNNGEPEAAIAKRLFVNCLIYGNAERAVGKEQTAAR
ncbi:MAG: sugar-binding domain-containing protein, partial [Phycisphaerae bacterium]